MVRKQGTLVRFEYEDNNVTALWQDSDGNRWYEVIVKDGVVQF